jgi:methylenetetrahydrofolate reductase (NADPH)
MDNLAAKMDAGADRAITQFFFDNAMFYRLQDRCAARGIDKPIVPGILLIHDFVKVCNFAARCNASIPDWLHARFAGLENDLEAQKLVAVSVAAEQVLDLAAQGIRHFHFFTLNRPDLALAMCRCLGIMPGVQQPAAA